MSNQDNDKLSAAMEDLINQRADALDGQTRSRLNQARQRALDELAPAKRARRFGVLPIAGASAAALVVALVFATRPGIAPVTAPSVAQSAPVAAADDFDLLLAGDDLEMIEDFEFYAVLEVL